MEKCLYTILADRSDLDLWRKSFKGMDALEWANLIYDVHTVNWEAQGICMAMAMKRGVKEHYAKDPLLSPS